MKYMYLGISLRRCWCFCDSSKHSTAVLFKEGVHWHCKWLLAQCNGRGRRSRPCRGSTACCFACMTGICCRELGSTQIVGVDVENVDKWYHFGNSFSLSLHSGISSGCQTAGWALFLYLLKRLCASGAVGISHAPLHLPTSLRMHVLQALHKQEPQLTWLGLPPPAGVSCPFLFLPAVCHLFQWLVTLRHQQLSCSADVSWVLGGLIRELYVHALWVLSKWCF